MAVHEDAGLLDKISRFRDEGAFAKLYDSYSKLVFGISCRLLGDRLEAEEILQTVFLYAWENAASYKPERGSPGAWLNMMTRSRCIDKLRHRSYLMRKERPIEKEGTVLPGRPAQGLENLILDERKSGVQKALAQLPGDQRAAIETAFFQGLTQQETARKLKVPLGTIKTRIRIGMKKLAQILGPEAMEK